MAWAIASPRPLLPVARAREGHPCRSGQNVRQIFGCDTRPLVLDIDEYLVESEITANGHQHRLAWRREAHSVIDEVQHYLAQLVGLSLNGGGCLASHDEADVLRFGNGGHLIGDVAKKAAHIHSLKRQRHRAIETREGEEVGHQAAHAAQLTVHGAHRALHGSLVAPVGTYQ